MTLAGDADFAAAGRMLDPLCRKVGLEPADLPAGKQIVAAPPSTALWSSSYAHLLLWPVDDAAPQHIVACANQAEGWFEQYLSQQEVNSGGRPIDGYLVLALPQFPQAGSSDEIRKLELSARICRKHMIWPSKELAEGETERSWCRIADVTVLGLPDAAMAGASELYWPKIDGEAQQVYSDLALLGAPATAQRDATA